MQCTIPLDYTQHISSEAVIFPVLGHLCWIINIRIRLGNGIIIALPELRIVGDIFALVGLDNDIVSWELGVSFSFRSHPTLEGEDLVVVILVREFRA